MRPKLILYGFRDISLRRKSETTSNEGPIRISLSHLPCRKLKHFTAFNGNRVVLLLVVLLQYPHVTDRQTPDGQHIMTIAELVHVVKFLRIWRRCIPQKIALLKISTTSTNALVAKWLLFQSNKIFYLKMLASKNLLKMKPRIKIQTALNFDVRENPNRRTLFEKFQWLSSVNLNGCSSFIHFYFRCISAFSCTLHRVRKTIMK